MKCARPASVPLLVSALLLATFQTAAMELLCECMHKARISEPNFYDDNTTCHLGALS